MRCLMMNTLAGTIMKLCVSCPWKVEHGVWRLTKDAVDQIDFGEIEAHKKARSTGSNSVANPATAIPTSQATAQPTRTLTTDPVQLPNGNWACRHKCGDKTKYVASSRSEDIVIELTLSLKMQTHVLPRGTRPTSTARETCR